MGRATYKLIFLSLYAFLFYVSHNAFADRQAVFDMLRLAPSTLPACNQSGQLRVDTATNLLNRCNSATTTWEPVATYAGTPSNGQILIGNGTTFALATITGTANQVTVTNGPGTITLSTPQSLAAASSPTFTGLTISGLSSGAMYSASGVASSETFLSKTRGGTGITSTATFPSSGVIVTESAVETLTSKTLTAPVINSPTGIVKGDVGLGNVDNTSDATKNAASVTLTNKTIDASSNTISNIANTNVSGTAAIAFSKLAALTSAHVVLGNVSNVATDTAVSGDVTISNTGVTAIGAAKITNSMIAASTIDLTAKVTGLLPIANGGTNTNITLDAGGAPYYTASGFGILNHGTSGQVYTSGGTGAPTWTSALTNPMTTGGDIIYGGAAGAATRLANGTAGQELQSAGGTSPPTWVSPSVINPGTGQVAVGSARITNNGTCAIGTQTGTTGNYISSVSRPSAGQCTLNFIAGVFTTAPVCTCAAAGGEFCRQNVAPTTSAFTFVTTTVGSVNTDVDTDVICVGKH